MVISLINFIIYKGKLNPITKKNGWRNIINFVAIAGGFHVYGNILELWQESGVQMTFFFSKSMQSIKNYLFTWISKLRLFSIKEKINNLSFKNKFNHALFYTINNHCM